MPGEPMHDAVARRRKLELRLRRPLSICVLPDFAHIATDSSGIEKTKIRPG